MNQPEVLAAVTGERVPYLRLVFIRYPNHPVPPAELLHVIAKGLAKDPAERYQSVTEMLAELLRLGERRFPVSCPATLAKRMPDVVGRAVNRYPKLLPFLLCPLLLFTLGSLIRSILQLIATLH